jgi:hypothetical protein
MCQVDGICRKFAMKPAAFGGFCTAKFSSRKIFCAVRSTSCRRHAWYARIQGSHAGPTLSAYDFCVSLVKSTREAPAVDHTLKLNVLAVCAVFAFVGAILLGAF